VSGDGKGKIRRWLIENGKEVGAPMDAGSAVLDIVTRWKVDRQWDAKWPGDGVEFRKSLQSDRVQSTRHWGVCRRLARRNENRDWITGQNCLRLVAVDWRKVTRPLGTQTKGTDASSPLPHGIATLFGSMTVRMAASLSSSQSESSPR